MSRQDACAGILAVVFLMTLVFMPVQAATPTCYRTKTGVVCPQGQMQNGGSGITPVKRLRP